MESEFELHQSIQELHALAAMPSLYPLAVEMSLPSTLLGLLAHENADISCSVIDLLKETTDDDILEDNEDECIAFVDSLLDQQVLSLLTQNLDRLDETNKDEIEGVHNTLSIFENLFETRSHLCDVACENVRGNLVILLAALLQVLQAYKLCVTFVIFMLMLLLCLSFIGTAKVAAKTN